MQATRVPVARPAARMTVKAQAQQPKPQKASFAKAAAATFAAVALLAAPAFADDVASTIKPKICAANPTAKVCLKNSYSK